MEPSAAVPRDDLHHQHAADHAAELKRVGRWAFDADAGHELGPALVLDSRHALAGVDVDALADGGLELTRRVRATVLDIFPSVDDRPCKRQPIEIARRRVSLGVFMRREEGSRCWRLSRSRNLPSFASADASAPACWCDCTPD
jgi:hypothetical protein